MGEQLEMVFPGEDQRDPQCTECTDVPRYYKGCFCRDYEEGKDK